MSTSAWNTAARRRATELLWWITLGAALAFPPWTDRVAAQPVSYLSGVAETVGRLADPATPARERAELSDQIVARGPGAVPLLLELAGSRELLVRAAAVRVLALMPLDDYELVELVPQLTTIFANDTEPTVRVQAAAALGATRNAAALEPLRQAAEDDDRDIRQAAVQALGRLNRPEAIPVLTRAARDADLGVRGAALRGLFDLKALDALRLIKPTVTDAATSVTIDGYLSMLESESAASVPVLAPGQTEGAQGLVRRILVREQRSLHTVGLMLITLPAILGAGRVFFKGTGRRVQFVATTCFVVVATPLAIWLTGFRTSALPREALGLDSPLPVSELLLLLPTVLGATFMWTRTRPRLADLALHTATWTLVYAAIRLAVSSTVPAMLGEWTLTNTPLTSQLGPGWRDTLAVALLVLLASLIRQFGSPETQSKRVPRLSLSVGAFVWTLGLSVAALSAGYVLLGAYTS